jgi:hypothetical protein
VNEPPHLDGAPSPPRPAVIDAVYRAFAGCPLSDPLAYCTYCDTPAYERALHAPLAALPRELIEKYLRDAIHHTGDARDFVYFVPRIVELDHEQALDAFSAFPGCLAAADFPAWPDERRTALLRALEQAATRGDRRAVWLGALAQIPGVDWDAVFSGWPGQGDPRGQEADDLENALLCGSITWTEPDGEDADRVNALFRRFLETPRGAAFATAHLERRARARTHP